MTVEELMKIKGAQAVIQFDAQGRVTERKGEIAGVELSDELASLLARFFHLNMLVAKSQVEDYTVMGGVGLEYPTAFGLITSTLVVFTRGNKAVVLNREQVDYNEVIKGSW